ncbi:DNA polymerase I [Salmonella phage 41]|nr:DNA polymerase I [Salmonella phage 41]
MEAWQSADLSFGLSIRSKVLSELYNSGGGVKVYGEITAVVGNLAD